MLRVLHLLKRFQYSYGPNSTILCSLAEYKESDSTACLAVASLKGRVTSVFTAGIKTAILAEHTTSAFTGHKTGLGGPVLAAKCGPGGQFSVAKNGPTGSLFSRSNFSRDNTRTLIFCRPHWTLVLFEGSHY